MKKIYLLVSLVIILASCDKREVELKVDPILISESGIVGIIYDGNTSCDELEGSFVASTGKIDYVNGSFAFEQGASWPFGLEVTVSEDGRYISFTLPASSQYCVGAVIAKGGNASNVFTYNPGVKGDEGLSSPINSSGNPAQLSNLTFCFVECEEELPVVIAVKAFYSPGPNYDTYLGGTSYSFLLSAGVEYPFTLSPCHKLGINYYPNVTSFSIKDYYYQENVGTVTVSEGVNTLSVTVKLKEGGLLDKTYLYVGSKEGILSTAVDGCPDYSSNPLWHFDDSNANEVTFIIPF